jgi:hypothetical protein
MVSLENTFKRMQKYRRNNNLDYFYWNNTSFFLSQNNGKGGKA